MTFSYIEVVFKNIIHIACLYIKKKLNNVCIFCFFYSQQAHNAALDALQDINVTEALIPSLSPLLFSPRCRQHQKQNLHLLKVL